MILSILIIAGVTGAFGLTVVYFVGKNILQENIGNEFQHSAQETSKSLSRLFKQQIDEAYVLSIAPLVLDLLTQSGAHHLSPHSGNQDLLEQIRREWKEETRHAILSEKLLTNPVSHHLQFFHRKLGRSDEDVGTVVIDQMGIAVAATLEPKEIYFGNRPWWKSVINASEGEVYISEIELASPFLEAAKHYTISIAVPIYDPKGPKPIGAILTVQSVKSFFELVTQVKLAKTDHTMLASSDGNLLFCPIFLVKNHTLHPELVQKISQDQPGWGMTRVDVHYPGAKSINGFAPVVIKNAVPGSFGGDRWFIFTSQNPEETYAPIRTLLLWIAGSGLMGIGLLGFFGFYATSQLIQPIKELQKGAKRIAMGDLQYRLHIKTGDEIEELSSEFNQMAEKVKASYAGLEQKVNERTQDLAARNKELSSLYIIASLLNTSLNLKELLDQALSATLKIFGIEAGVIHLLDETGMTLNEISMYGLAARLQNSSQKNHDETILYRQVVQKRIPLSFSDNSLKEKPFKGSAFPCFITIPILSKGKALGTLSLLDKAPRPFLKQELDLLIAIGNQIGVAIENSRLYEETKKVDQLKSDFVSKVSHEFRTPLTSIKGFVEILLSYTDIPSEKQKEFLSIINQESDRLIRLINDVLDLSKIEAGRVTWRIEPLDFSELINASAKTMQSLVEAKKLQLGTEIDSSFPQVLGDRDQLTQVLNNLLSNAIKFTQRGRITLFAKRLNEREVLAGVKDTGIGLPSGELTKIFNKFYQVARTQKDLPKGTGLGLAICREIIHYLKGEIWCESTLGEGSTFYFTLPVAFLAPDEFERASSLENK